MAKNKSVLGRILRKKTKETSFYRKIQSSAIYRYPFSYHKCGSVQCGTNKYPSMVKVSVARMTLTGVGCRLQTCSRLASERFDSAFCAPPFYCSQVKEGFSRVWTFSKEKSFTGRTGLPLLEYFRVLVSRAWNSRRKQTDFLPLFHATSAKQAEFCLSPQATLDTCYVTLLQVLVGHMQYLHGHKVASFSE